MAFVPQPTTSVERTSGQLRSGFRLLTPNVQGQRGAGTLLAKLDDASRRVLCTVGLGVMPESEHQDDDVSSDHLVGAQ